MKPEAVPPGNMGSTIAASSSLQGELTVGRPAEVPTKPYDPELRRENIRAWLAVLLVAAFLALTGFLVWGVVSGRMELATAKDLTALTLTPLFGLTSTAVGFYYAGTKN